MTNTQEDFPHFDNNGRIVHDKKFKIRRALNWFPMGLAYAFLYMGRYNLTVSKNALGDLMTKEDFGIIFAAGTITYAFSFLLNGPLTDKMGGKKAILIALSGSALMNFLMGLFIRTTLISGDTDINLTFYMSFMYAINMYFQSFGAVAIVKVNAHWFHVRERGGFSGIFGTMISSGIFFAFTVNGWVLSFVKGSGPGGTDGQWWCFFAPSICLVTMLAIELFLLKDRPGLAGHRDFDTGDASSGEGEANLPVFEIMKRIITNPIILTLALIEFCTGVLRNGVMHWFPFYAKEILVLPSNHLLRYGSWGNTYVVIGIFILAAVFFFLGSKSSGKRKAYLLISGSLVALSPFVQGGWGGLLFIAGVIGGNVAGWVSDLFFQSRRAPAAGGLYAILTICSIFMIFSLGGSEPTVGWSKGDDYPLKKGDRILMVNGVKINQDWSDVARAVACIPAKCLDGAKWDTGQCMCTSRPKQTTANLQLSNGVIPITVQRGDKQVELKVPDHAVSLRAGEKRKLKAGPKLTLNPLFLGLVIFFMSVCVIGTHGLLSGTATMDFGGRKAAATAVGIIDGFVYLGTGVQSICLGFLTTKSWSYWPLFLIPFGVIGFLLSLRIWNAKPKGSGGH